MKWSLTANLYYIIYSFFANLASRKRRSAKLRLTRLAFVL
jgi:hypothetical protein